MLRRLLPDENILKVMGRATVRLVSLPGYSTQIDFRILLPTSHRTGLDSSETLPVNSHPPALVEKSTASNTHHPKTDIVVDVVALPDIVVAVR